MKIYKYILLPVVIMFLNSCNYCQSVNCLYTIDEHDKYGLIDNKGKKVFSPKFDFISEEPVGDSCHIFDEDGKNHGYIDKYGLHYLKYWVESFSEGLAAFKENNYWGFINKMGEVVINPRFKINYQDTTPDDIPDDYPSPFFSEGLCAIALSFSDEKGELLYGYISKEGEVVLAPRWLYVSQFKEGLAIVIDVEGNRYYINKQGIATINLKSNEIGRCFYHDRATICSGEDEEKKCYFIDSSGIQTSPVFDDADDFHEGLAKVKKKGKWGFIGEDGKFIIQPLYQDVSFFSEGLASATVLASDNNMKTGVINRQGNFILPPEKDTRFGQFRCGIVSKFIRDGFNYKLKAYVDQNGRIIWEK